MAWVRGNLLIKEWLLNKLLSWKLTWGGPRLKLGEMGLFERSVNTTVRFPGSSAKRAAILKRLEGFNLSLKTSSWHIVNEPNKEDETSGEGDS